MCKKCKSAIFLEKSFPVREEMTDHSKLYFTMKCPECKEENIYYQQNIEATKSVHTNRLGALGVVMVISLCIVPFLIPSYFFTAYFISMLLLFLFVIGFGVRETQQMDEFNSMEWEFDKELFLKNSPTPEKNEPIKFDEIDIIEFRNTLTKRLPKCKVKSEVVMDDNAEASDLQCGVIHLTKYKLNNLVGIVAFTSTNSIIFNLFDRDGQFYILAFRLEPEDERFLSSAMDLFVEMLNCGNYPIR